MTKAYANESYDLEQYIRLEMRQLNCTPKKYLPVLARKVVYQSKRTNK